jgi:hypothetical protein
VVSDYRFRGATLSDGRPAAQGALTYDHSSGLYLGLFASTVRLATNDATGVQGVGQAGYAIRATPAVMWDIGAFYSAFSNPSALDYADFYVGAAGTEWSARLSYSPRYFGQPYSASYAELNLTPFSQFWLVPLVHVGRLSPSSPPSSGIRSRWDGRFGVAYNHDPLTLQASWVTASRAQEYPEGQSKSGWVIRVTAWF